jgi:hypothetical protein
MTEAGTRVGAYGHVHLDTAEHPEVPKKGDDAGVGGRFVDQPQVRKAKKRRRDSSI